MIRCNNCMKYFTDDTELTKILETEVNGETIRKLYELESIDETTQSVIDGCPHCMTDEYLMNLDISDVLEEVLNQFEQIADNHELCGVEVSVCDNCERTYPRDWIISNVCPFCLKEHTEGVRGLGGVIYE